ncbi:MAG: hypothetical protein CML31_05420 [Rhizobiales bacterium]|nr:hypothetical protein [Hyphomicrobiales bacterium]
MKPASRVIAKALPQSGGTYRAQFALPGLIPEYVRNPDGTVFETESQVTAREAACVALVGLLESRVVDPRRAGGYRRMSAANLGSVLAEIDITPTYFAELIGVPQARIIKWLDGEQDIPHYVWPFTELLKASDQNFKIAEKIAKDAQEEGA